MGRMLFQDNMDLRGYKMTTLKQAVELVKGKKEFKAGNVFALNYPVTGYYIVFSYGLHWPLFIYDYAKKQWYGNSGKYSAMTSKHYRALNPGNVLPLPCEEMKRLVGAANR